MTAKLIYFATRSLDGYIEDEHGKLDWAKFDEERQQFINEQLHPTGTYLYGRRMYETMLVWREFGSVESDPGWAREFGTTWRTAEKIVYSKSLKEVELSNTRLERTFDADAVRAMKSQAVKDLVMGGHELAVQACKFGLIDEFKLFIAPVTLGGGRKAIPEGMRLDLEVIDERYFKGSGVVYLHYRRCAG